MLEIRLFCVLAFYIQMNIVYTCWENWTRNWSKYDIKANYHYSKAVL